MTLTHTCDTSWADSAHGNHSLQGLTPLGQKVVEEMNRLGMMVDIRFSFPCNRFASYQHLLPKRRHTHHTTTHHTTQKDASEDCRTLKPMFDCFPFLRRMQRIYHLWVSVHICAGLFLLWHANCSFIQRLSNNFHH